MSQSSAEGKIKDGPRKILVTGAASFTARYLIDLLRKRFPAAQLCLSDCPGKDPEINGKRMSVQSADAGVKGAFTNLVKTTRPSHIVHLTGLSSGDPRTVFDANFWSTYEILSAAIKLNHLPTILIIGSAAQYGSSLKGTKVLPEEYSCLPVNLYGLSKRCQEELGLMFHRTEGLDVRFARTFNLLGPSMNEASVLGRIIAQIKAAQGAPVSIKTGSLSTYRDFIDIRDAIQAYAAILIDGKPGIVYNVGSSIARRVRDVVKLLINISGAAVTIDEQPKPFRPYEPTGGAADIRKTMRIMKQYALIPLERTLKDCLDYGS